MIIEADDDGSSGYSRCQKDCHDSDHYSSQSGSLCGNPLIIRGSYAECGQNLIDLFCLMKMIVTRHSMTIEGLRKSKGVADGFMSMNCGDGSYKRINWNDLRSIFALEYSSDYEGTIALQLGAPVGFGGVKC